MCVAGYFLNFSFKVGDDDMTRCINHVHVGECCKESSLAVLLGRLELLDGLLQQYALPAQLVYLSDLSEQTQHEWSLNNVNGSDAKHAEMTKS